MRHTAAALAIFLLAAASSACSHVNSPGGFVRCMENSEDERAAEQLIFAMLDQDGNAALESAFTLIPDVVKCFLQKAAALKATGGKDADRARKAKMFLDAHGQSSLHRGGPEMRWLAPWIGVSVPTDASDELLTYAHAEMAVTLWIDGKPVYEPIPLTAHCALYVSSTQTCYPTWPATMPPPGWSPPGRGPGPGGGG